MVLDVHNLKLHCVRLAHGEVIVGEQSTPHLLALEAELHAGRGDSQVLLDLRFELD
jgi:hypothetical protein